MKNKNIRGLLWLFALVASIFTYSCKQPDKGGGGKPSPSNQITITVASDDGFTLKTPSTFTVNKNSLWQDIKITAESKITPKGNFTIKEWRLKNKDGKVLKDSDKFEEDATVFAISSSNVVSLILNLDGGTATTQLEDGQNGNKILKGAPGDVVKVEGLTKENHAFEKWEPPLPQVFPQTNDETVYKAQWKEAIKITLKGDERLQIKDGYVSIPKGESKTFAEIKNDVLSKTSFKSGWNTEFYEVYDFKVADEDGDDITDATQITEGLTIYIRSNYKKFSWQDTELIGYEGNKEKADEKPKGRIIIPKNTTKIGKEAFEECNELTVLDCSGCSVLTDIGEYDQNINFAGGESLTTIKLKGCSNLEKVELAATAITSMDFSQCPKVKTIDLFDCKNLASIILTGCAVLNYIDLSQTAITGIDLSQCSKVTEIYLDQCTSLASINLTGCAALKTIQISKTLITDLNLSQATSLTQINCQECKKLATVNLEGCSELEAVDFSYSGITSIDLSQCTKMTEVIFYGCEKLANVNLTGCAEITTADLFGTAITSIDFSPCPAITEIKCDSSKNLANIIITGCTEITSIYLSNTAITNIDLSECTLLKKLNLLGSKIAALDVKKCTELDLLDLSKTPITDIDVSECKTLSSLMLAESKIASLNISKNTELEFINLANTSITAIDLSECTKLKRVSFENCKELSSIDLEKCKELEEIGWSGLYDDKEIKFLSFSGCTKAVVKLPNSITRALQEAFGKDESTWCKEVHVPKNEIKVIVELSGYPKDRIKTY